MDTERAVYDVLAVMRRRLDGLTLAVIVLALAIMLRG